MKHLLPLALIVLLASCDKHDEFDEYNNAKKIGTVYYSVNTSCDTTVIQWTSSINNETGVDTLFNADSVSIRKLYYYDTPITVEAIGTAGRVQVAILKVFVDDLINVASGVDSGAVPHAAASCTFQ